MVRIITCSLLAFLSLFSTHIFGQNSVGIGTPSPNPKAVLELVSPGGNQGLMVPRLTTAQRTATSFTSTLKASENGLLVFDADEQKFYYWQTNQWLPIRSGSDSALTAGTGITITGNTISVVPDGDGSSTNELQDLQLTGNSLKITGSPTAATIDLSALVLANETQNLQLTGNTLKITGNPSATPIDLSALTMADNSATNEIQDLQLTGNTLKITGNSSATPIDLSTLTLADNSATNEIQDLQLVGSTLSITNNPSATPVNLSAFTGTNTDDQTLSYNGSNGQLSISTLTSPQTVTITTAGTAGGDLAGTYPNPTIGTGKVTSTTILDGTIATADLANTSVTDAKVAMGISVSKVTAGTNGQFLSTVTGVPTWTTLTSLPPNGTAGGDLTGSFPNPTINANAVTSAKILDGTIVNADIANVDASKITSGTLPLTVGGTGATTAAAARTNLGLGSLSTLSAITSTEITDGTIATIDLANASVTDAKIASGITPSKVTASGTPGQVLTTVGTTTVWANLPAFGTGTVTNIATGTGLTGGPITTTGTISLVNTGVTAATYGSATQVPVLTVDLQGRITAASTAAVTASGTAGGDLTGSYPNPTIIANAVTSAKIADGTIVNADIANVDASKITGTLPVANGGTAATTAAGARTNLGLGTLATLSAVGSTEITDGSILNADILTVDAGKITTGTLPVARGGSGITAVTPGAVAYGGATNFAFTAAGTAGQFLQSNGSGAPTWVNAPTGTTPNLSSVLTAGNSAGTAKITNLGTPTLPADATTKAYVDNLDNNDFDKSSSNELQGLKSVVSIDADASGASIINVGAIGIGTGSPNANLSVIGSHSVSFTIPNANYGVKKDDYLVLADGTVSQVVLPPAAEIPGRVLILRSIDNKGTLVRPRPGDTIDALANVTIVDSESQVNAITVVADGKNTWWVVNKSIKAN